MVALLLAGVAIVRFDLDTQWFGARRPGERPRGGAPARGAARCPRRPRSPRSARRPARSTADPARVAAAIGPMLQRKGVLGPHIGVLVADLAHGPPALPRRHAAGHPGQHHQAAHLDGGPGVAGPDGPLPHDGALGRRRSAGSCWSVAATRSWPAARRPRAPATPHKADVVTLARKAAAGAPRQAGAPGPPGLRRLLLQRAGRQPGVAGAPTSPRASYPRSARCGSTRATRRGSEAFVSDPAAEAARVFAAALRQAGVRVAPKVVRAKAGPDTADLAGGAEPAAGPDRRAHPRGQRQQGRRGARPPRRARARSSRARSPPAPRPSSTR